MCFKYIKIYNKWKMFLKKHRKIKKDINNKRFPVRDISVNFRFGFGLHFLPTTLSHVHDIRFTSICFIGIHVLSMLFVFTRQEHMHLHLLLSWVCIALSLVLWCISIFVFVFLICDHYVCSSNYRLWFPFLSLFQLLVVKFLSYCGV